VAPEVHAAEQGWDADEDPHPLDPPLPEYRERGKVKKKMISLY